MLLLQTLCPTFEDGRIAFNLAGSTCASSYGGRCFLKARSSSQSSEISTKSKVGGGAETAVITVRTVSSERRCMKGTKHGRPADILQTGGVYILFFCTRYILHLI